MTRVAPRVHVDADAIARLEAIGLQLPESERVRVQLEDGSEIEGVIEAAPGIQVYFDPDGREGMQALVRLEAFLDDGRPHPGGIRNIWVDEIRAVMRLPNASPPEPSTRIAPPDPNAPAPEPRAQAGAGEGVASNRRG
jgi:hypothetical protein